MDYIDYRTKLGLGFDDKRKQDLFISRIQVFLQTNGSVPFLARHEAEFCYQIGEQCLLPTNFSDDPNILMTAHAGLQRVWLYLKKKNFLDMLSCIVIFANTYIGASKYKATIQEAIEYALKDSHIAYEIFHDSDGIFYFPKGAKELDIALVNQPLEWLSDYPKARTAFIKAMQGYVEASERNASDIADKLRKSLEAFFQEFFGGEKALENYKSDYGKYLKSQSIPSEITGNLESLLQSYTNFMNNYAKHQDRTSPKILEYLMYQTGNIIRLLITLKQEETSNAY